MKRAYWGRVNTPSADELERWVQLDDFVVGETTHVTLFLDQASVSIYRCTQDGAARATWHQTHGA